MANADALNHWPGCASKCSSIRRLSDCSTRSWSESPLSVPFAALVALLFASLDAVGFVCLCILALALRLDLFGVLAFLSLRIAGYHSESPHSPFTTTNRSSLEIVARTVGGKNRAELLSPPAIKASAMAGMLFVRFTIPRYWLCLCHQCR